MILLQFPYSFIGNIKLDKKTIILVFILIQIVKSTR